MRRKEFCICGKDITGNYLGHPPLWHFYDLGDNSAPDNEPWDEYDGLYEAVTVVTQGSAEPEHTCDCTPTLTFGPLQTFGDLPPGWRTATDYDYWEWIK